MDDNTKEIIQYAEWREKCALYEEKIRMLTYLTHNEEVYMSAAKAKHFDEEDPDLDLSGIVSTNKIIEILDIPHSKEAIEILNAKRAEVGMELIPVEVDVIGECEDLK